jgi:hypothetical protein
MPHYLIQAAYTSESEPTANYGTRDAFRIDASPIRNSYLRFEVQGIEAVQSAALRIFAETSNSVGFDVRGVGDNTWEESTITYDNMGSFGAVVGSSGPVSGGNWCKIDVTSLVLGDGPVSFALTSASSTATRFSSREGCTPRCSS